MPERVLIEPGEFSSVFAAEDVVFIDTRESVDFAAGHIPGAVNVPEIFSFLTTPGHDGVDEIIAVFSELFGKSGLSGAQRAVLYEQSMDSGLGRSCRGYFLLKLLGYEKASVLHGGLDAWINQELPITREFRAPTPQQFPVKPAISEYIVDAQGMLAALKNSDIVKLDVRDFDEWFGISSSPYGIDYCPRKGRIPEARWLEWYRMMKPGPIGPVFKSPEEILAECRTVGITQDTPVILYCFKGARTSNTFVALKEAGVKNVRNYFGSWNEWSRDPALPIDEGLLKGKEATDESSTP
jgi:thiosulfate/3-mercaptopyruvate sulfurtransferase